ncbi:MAG TPA: phage portal protein [bacterium]|nr:phage portal protein [bacterium]
MGEKRIDSAVASDLSSAMQDFSVPSESLDSPGDGKETRWPIKNWKENLGYFNQIPELTATINAKATWTIGKGFKADPQTTFICDSIRGNKMDTFNTILENMIRTYYIAGDSFAEIIRDKEENLINLKCLNPGRITIVTGEQGRVKRYEDNWKGKITKFKPEQIFHLSRNRIGDQIHGVSVITSVENIILARNEAIADYKIVMHRNVYPRMIFHLDTDDDDEIAAFKTKMDNTYKLNENFYVPKDVVIPELMAVAPNATLDPKAWIEAQGDFFYEAVGVPQIILGGSGEFTEASAKIAYLAFQQNIEEEQLFIEEQIGIQLGLEIELEFPASLENELLSDKAKDGAENIQPNETTAGSGQ